MLKRMRRFCMGLMMAAMVVAVMAGAASALVAIPDLSDYEVDPKNYPLGGDTVIYQYGSKVVVREADPQGDDIKVWPLSDIGSSSVTRYKFEEYNIKRFIYSGSTMYVAVRGDQSKNQGGRFATVDDDFKIIDQFKPADKDGYAPTAEFMAAYGGSIYGLSSFCLADEWPYAYKPSTVYKLNKDMTVAASVDLKDTAGNECLNSENAAVYNGKMYVTSIGGSQGIGEVGSIWEVDLSAMSAKQLIKFDPAKFPGDTHADRQPYGIAIADDGTVMYLISFGWGNGGVVYKATIAELQNGILGDRVYGSEAAESFSIQYINGDFWLNDSGALIILDKDGNELQKFTSDDLSPPNDPGYSLSSFSPIVADDQAGVVYTTVNSTYTGGTLGRVYATEPDDPTDDPARPVILSDTERAEIRTYTGIGGSATVESISSGNATTTTDRVTAGRNLGSESGNNVTSVVITKTDSALDAMVFGLNFEITDGMATVGGKTVTPPLNLSEATRNFSFWIAFGASKLDLFEEYDIVELAKIFEVSPVVYESGELAPRAVGTRMISVTPKVVLVSQPGAKLPNDPDWSDGTYAVKLSDDGSYLCLYDSTGTAKITAAVAAKSDSWTSDGSSSCDAGAGLTALAILGAAALLRGRKK